MIGDMLGYEEFAGRVMYKYRFLSFNGFLHLYLLFFPENKEKAQKSTFSLIEFDFFFSLNRPQYPLGEVKWKKIRAKLKDHKSKIYD